MAKLQHIKEIAPGASSRKARRGRNPLPEPTEYLSQPGHESSQENMGAAMAVVSLVSR